MLTGAIFVGMKKKWGKIEMTQARKLKKENTKQLFLKMWWCVLLCFSIVKSENSKLKSNRHICKKNKVKFAPQI